MTLKQFDYTSVYKRNTPDMYNKLLDWVKQKVVKMCLDILTLRINDIIYVNNRKFTIKVQII